MKFITLTILLGSLLITGCSQITLVVDDPYDFRDDRVYMANFDDTWSALIKAIERYPIITIEKDSGVLLTDWVGDYSPNQYFVKKQYGTPDMEYGMGIDVSETDDTGIIVTSVLENSSAEKAGIQKGDHILKVDGYYITSYQDVQYAVNSEGAKVLTIRRSSTSDTFDVKVTPQALRDIFSKVYARYRFNIRVSSIDDHHTEVKVINYEEAKNVFASESYYHVPSAMIREKEILDRIDNELKDMTAQ